MTGTIEKERVENYIKDLNDDDARELLKLFDNKSLIYELFRREVQKTSRLNAIQELVEGDFR